jgi:hypothetical protein
MDELDTLREQDRVDLAGRRCDLGVGEPDKVVVGHGVEPDFVEEESNRY